MLPMGMISILTDASTPYPPALASHYKAPRLLVVSTLLAKPATLIVMALLDNLLGGYVVSRRDLDGLILKEKSADERGRTYP